MKLPFTNKTTKRVSTLRSKSLSRPNPKSNGKSLFHNFFRRRNAKPIQPKDPHLTGFKSKSTQSNKTKRSNRIFASLGSTLKLLLIVALFIVASGLVVYFGVNTVLRLREDTNKQDLFAAGEVIGFDKIPAFPGSEFVFDTTLSDEIVKKFIGKGYSIYRLPVNKDINAVYDFYSSTLTTLGWKSVMEVELGSSDKMNGQYWTKDGSGLRIFGKINDIWYQKLSESDANEGLAREVALNNEKKLILAQANSTSLLPDYPWKMSVPIDYTVKYFISKLNDLSGIEFTGTNVAGKVSLIPFALYNGLTYDAYIDEYTKQNNLRIINSVVTQVKGVVATQASVTDGSKNGSIIAINNVKNNVVYMIYAEDETNQLLDYLKANLEIVDYAKLTQ